MLVDDHTFVCKGIAALLATESDFEIGTDPSNRDHDLCNRMLGEADQALDAASEAPVQ